MEPTVEKKKNNRRPVIILSVLAFLGLSYFAYWYGVARKYESTDNAQVDGHVLPVLPKAGGYIAAVLVADNQPVKAGQLLVTIDSTDYILRQRIAQAAVENAQSALAAAQSNIAAAQAQVAVTDASVQTASGQLGVAQANADKLVRDLTRAKALHQDDVIPRSDLDAVNTAELTARSQLISAKGQRLVAESQRNAALSQLAAVQNQLGVLRAQLAQRVAELENATLQLSYCKVYAPASGIISKKNVEPGQLVNIGQPLLTVVASNEVWITANFKETQLEKMRAGQAVEVAVDAYPGHTFSGEIQSLSAATGARFALLPPDNASGNFIKVVQRVPVKIILPKGENEFPLVVGMNVSVKVKVL